jgi:hypothetical protein
MRGQLLEVSTPTFFDLPAIPLEERTNENGDL